MTNRTFSYDDTSFLLDGRPIQLLSGELHYQRIPREYWGHRLRLARAMGLNAVCIYMFWNLHEADQGRWDFTGRNDVAAFVRAAADEGLLVIARPGPYVCAEWDFGGLPPWLLRHADSRVRCSDERYMAAARAYVAAVSEQLTGLQCTRGGPVVMLQVENEYGSYGNDVGHMRILRDEWRRCGWDVPFFTSNGGEPRMLRAGTVEDTLSVVNFGNEPEKNFAALRAFMPKGPLMCGEFWAGWFDHWGAPRGKSDDAQQAKDLAWMAERGISFNIYMLHGGTNFGFTAGANDLESYKPDVTSYDYHAAIDEAGRPTPKYYAFREILARYQPAGAALPPVPPNLPVVTIPRLTLTESAPLFPEGPAVRSPQPLTIEALGQSHGLVLYRTSIAGLGAGDLRVVDPHDYAIVSLNGARVGTLDRRLKQNTLTLTNVPDDRADLEILIDATGRTNYGPRLLDRKGITDRVELGILTLMNWDIFPIPLDAAHLARLRFTPARTATPTAPTFFRGHFDLREVGDTHLDLRGWSRGYVWVNGENLGRFWSVGPQQTLFCPAPFLKQGRNEILVLDLTPTSHRTIEGLREPILDDVR